MSHKSILTKDEFKTILSQIRKHMTVNLEQGPLLLINTDKGYRETYPLTEPIQVVFQEHRYIMSVGALLPQKSSFVDELIFVCQGWYVKRDDLFPTVALRPIEHSECQEAIMLFGRNIYNTRSVHMLQPFSRKGDGSLVWQPITQVVDMQPLGIVLDLFFCGQELTELFRKD